jgi:hypothetical protein
LPFFDFFLKIYQNMGQKLGSNTYVCVCSKDCAYMGVKCAFLGRTPLNLFVNSYFCYNSNGCGYKGLEWDDLEEVASCS